MVAMKYPEKAFFCNDIFMKNTMVVMDIIKLYMIIC